MPATPRSVPSLIRPQPPARSSVARMRPPAPRANASAAAPQSAAIGIAHAASRSGIPAVRCATAIAPGTAATPTRPSTTATEARWLLLRVGASNGGGRGRAADDAGDGDQRQHVRERLEEDGGGVGVRREPERQRGRRTEEDRRSVCAEGAPVPEDDRGERDEAAAVRHALVEGADEPDREVCAAEGGEDAGRDDGEVARPVHGDADRVRRPRVLADRADAT